MSITSSFIVTSARLSANERTLLINYKESGSDRVLPTQMEANGFERWLQAQPERDCPTLIEWMLSSPAHEVNTRLALYMEDQMSSAYMESFIRQTREA